MPEPTETVIISAQQSFEIGGGLNPVQIETDGSKYLKKI